MRLLSKSNDIEAEIKNIFFNVFPGVSDNNFGWKNLNINLDQLTRYKLNRELYEDIAWADLVVGVSSFALVVSLTAEVPTISILPPGINHCVLPYEEIMYLRDK